MKVAIGYIRISSDKSAANGSFIDAHANVAKYNHASFKEDHINKLSEIGTNINSNDNKEKVK